MADWTIRRLDKDHDRSAFDCGQPMLNEWLKDRAGQFDRRDLSRTFVAARSDEVLVVWYYAVSTHRVVYDALPTIEAKGPPRQSWATADHRPRLPNRYSQTSEKIV